MKKLLMLFAAVFAMSATSFAQVEAIPATPSTTEKAPSVKMKMKRGQRTAKNTTPIPADMRKASTPEVRTGKIVDRINASLVAKDPSLALNGKQREMLIDVHMKRQLVQSSRPKLETDADKEAFKASRKAASKEFKSSIKEILTPAQAEVYFANRSAKRGKRGAELKKPMKNKSVKDLNQGQKF